MSNLVIKLTGEIKEETIAAGVDVVNQFIGQQPAEFQLISHDTWLNEDHFAEALKGISLEQN